MSIELGKDVVFPMLQEDSAIGLCDHCLYVDLVLCHTVHCRLLFRLILDHDADKIVGCWCILTAGLWFDEARHLFPAGPTCNMVETCLLAWCNKVL